MPLEDAVEGEFFIRFNEKERSADELSSAIKKLEEAGIEIRHRYVTGIYHIRIDDYEKGMEKIDELKKSQEIESIEPVYKTKIIP
ncbi:MAG: hypothetical protein NTV63_00180 [Candidatus Woesearchaeota archaeon]|nr:hypothetical protein [Candidatus Woesearchaeota archaeon]